MVTARHMVWHEVHHYFKPGAVGAFHQGFEFFHAFWNRYGHIGVYVVVVFYRIG